MGFGGGGIRAEQEAKHSVRSTATGALIVFDSILKLPLINFGLLTQLLFSLLLCCFQSSILPLLFLQC